MNRAGSFSFARIVAKTQPEPCAMTNGLPPSFLASYSGSDPLAQGLKKVRTRNMRLVTRSLWTSRVSGPRARGLGAARKGEQTGTHYY